MAGIGHCLYKREKEHAREIQIKQFPIVTTHWWPKTRNERFVWENEQYLYRFLPLLHNHVQVIWVRTRIRCVTCVCARSGSRCIHTGRRRQRLTEGVSEAWCWRNFSSANGGVSQSDRLMQIPNPVHATPEKYVIGCCNKLWRRVSTTLQTCPPSSVDADAPCECSVSQSTRTHTSHTGCVCAPQITQKPLVSCLRPSMCSYDGELLIWISLCMFFFPLIETVTYTCHYMTDRLERFDLKTSKLDLLKKKNIYILDALGVSW